MEIRIGGGRVIGHARHLQDDLVDRRVVGLRQFLDRVAGHGVGRGADFRQEIIVPRLIEALHRGIQRRLSGGGSVWDGGEVGGALRPCCRLGLWFEFRRGDDDLRHTRRVCGFVLLFVLRWTLLCIKGTDAETDRNGERRGRDLTRQRTTSDC